MSELIIAAAGSGKTTYLIEQALKIKKKRVLITTFTEANERSIIEKIVELNGCIPCNIYVQTWFSFLLQHGVKPYQDMLFDGNIRGLLLVNTKSAVRCKSGSTPIYYPEIDVVHHYLSPELNIYSDKLSKFACRCNNLSGNIVIKRIAACFSYIFVDEVQDLAGYDLEIIKLLAASSIELMLVGDPRQVTYHTHNEAMYKKYAEGKIEDFVREHCKNISIDNSKLNTTYRNEASICALANSLYPDFKPCNALPKVPTGHDGVFIVDQNDVDEYIRIYHPMQLRDSVKIAVNEMADVLSFGDSKGLTFNRVLIYPTKPMFKWLQNHSATLKFTSKAKFYVAITRAVYSVAIVNTTGKSISIEGVPKWKKLPFESFFK